MKENISIDINSNITKINEAFGRSNDLITNNFRFDAKRELACVSLYIKNLVDSNILDSLAQELANFKYENDKAEPEMVFDALKNSFAGLRFISEGSDYETIYSQLLAGNTVFLTDGCSRFFSIATNNNEGRTINEPTSQTIIRGPKDSFTEKINTNILLIRKRIKNKNLRMEYLTLGSLTNTTISIIYIDKIARPEILQELKDRLGRIKIDSVLESGYIEEMIKDDKYSIFPTLLNSEKPDAVAGALLEGRVAILVDGTPYVITAPALMAEFFQTSEDYYHHFIISSAMRLLRFLAFILALIVPASYIAITTFHQEMVPTTLLISIAAQREGVPFPALMEALIMEITFEILREAGIRMPRAVGQAISIVGALVLGQAAVEAGVISAVMVIVVSITAISSFAIPNYEMSNAIRLIRFGLMLLAGVLGLYGVFMGLVVILFHLSKLKSVTVPYLSPVAPKLKGENKDTFLRFPLWSLKYRPAVISTADGARVADITVVKQKDKEKKEIR